MFSKKKNDKCKMSSSLKRLTRKNSWACDLVNEKPTEGEKMSWNEWKLKINVSLRHDDIFCARSIVTLILWKILYQHHGYPLFMPHHCFLVSKLPSLYTHTLLPFSSFSFFFTNLQQKLHQDDFSSFSSSSRGNYFISNLRRLQLCSFLIFFIIAAAQKSQFFFCSKEPPVEKSWLF